MDDDDDYPKETRSGRQITYTQKFQAGEKTSRIINKKKERDEMTNDNPAKKAKTAPDTDDEDQTDASAPPAPTTSAQTKKDAKIGKKQIEEFRNVGFSNFRFKHLKVPKTFTVAFPNLASKLNLIDEIKDYEWSMGCFQYAMTLFSSGNSLSSQTWLGLNPLFGFDCFRMGDDNWLFRISMGNLSSLNIPFQVFDFQLTEHQYQEEVKPLLNASEEEPELEHERLGSCQFQFQACGRRAVFLSRWHQITEKKKKEEGDEWVEGETDWNEEKSQAVLFHRVFKPLIRAIRHGRECLQCFLAESCCSSLDLLLKTLCNDLNRKIDVSYSNMLIRSSYKLNEGDRCHFEKWDDKELSTKDRATKNTPNEKSALQRAQELRNKGRRKLHMSNTRMIWIMKMNIRQKNF